MESRVRHLETTLSTLGFDDALRALDWMMAEMCVEKGYERHNGTHYYYHLVDTTQDLFNHGIKNQDILTAMLLHDAVEDVDGITPRMIEDKFNANVAIMVNLVTKVKGVNYKIEENMIPYLREILKNIGATLLKTSDRKHNFSTLRDATPEKKLRQALETQKLYIPFFKEGRILYPRYTGYFLSAKTAIEPHMWEIIERHEEVEELKKQLETYKGMIVCK